MYQYTAYNIVEITWTGGAPAYTYDDWRNMFATKRSGTWEEYQISTVQSSTISVANNGNHFVAFIAVSGGADRIFQSTDYGATWAESGTAPAAPSAYAWFIDGTWFVYAWAQEYYVSTDLTNWTARDLPVLGVYPYTANQFCIGEDNVLHVSSDPDGADEIQYTKSTDLAAWTVPAVVLGDTIPPAAGAYYWSALACTLEHVIVVTADEGGTDLVWNVSHDNGDTWEGEDSLATPAGTLDGEQCAVWIDGDNAFMSYRGWLGAGNDIYRIWIYRSTDWNGTGAITWSLWKTDVYNEDEGCATDSVNRKGYSVEFYPTYYDAGDVATYWYGELREMYPVADVVIKEVLPSPRGLTGNTAYLPNAGTPVINTFYSPPFHLSYDPAIYTKGLTVQQITRGGVSPSFVAAEDGQWFRNWYGHGRIFLHVVNDSAAAITVNVAIPQVGDPDGLAVPDLTTSVAAGADAMIGTFPSHIYNDHEDIVTVTYSSITSVSVAAYKMVV